jgi:hypothetical protein
MVDNPSAQFGLWSFRINCMGPANDGVSFANVDGNDNEEHAQNMNGRKAKGHQGERDMSQV